MGTLFINNLNERDVNHFTTDIGLYLRRTLDVPFKRACNHFTNANIIKLPQQYDLSDEEYFKKLEGKRIPLSSYPLMENKNNIVLERYPNLDKGMPYIFICNHTCPEDIETVLNVIDRNAYLVLGSIETLKYNPEIYLLWLNGVIPFDILDEYERMMLLEKMTRVIASNSLLIFPEGSHNYHPNKIINHLFDGPVNLGLRTNKKIVLITLVRDQENNVSYIDVINPIDVNKLDIHIQDYYPYGEQNEKYFVKSISSYLRDKMATATYHIMERHFDSIQRNDYEDIDNYFKAKYIEEAFTKLKWKHDAFKAEYLVKKQQEDKDYEEVVQTLYKLQLKNPMSYINEQYKDVIQKSNDYMQKKIDLDNKNVELYMRNYWLEHPELHDDPKELIKKRA